MQITLKIDTKKKQKKTQEVEARGNIVKMTRKAFDTITKAVSEDITGYSMSDILRLMTEEHALLTLVEDGRGGVIYKGAKSGKLYGRTKSTANFAAYGMK